MLDSVFGYACFAAFAGTVLGSIAFVFSRGADFRVLARLIGAGRFSLRFAFILTATVALDLAITRLVAPDSPLAAQIIVFVIGLFYSAALVAFVVALYEEFTRGPRARLD